jgi:ACS family hexuronate transporter-like MFS transporter
MSDVANKESGEPGKTTHPGVAAASHPELTVLPVPVSAGEPTRKRIPIRWCIASLLLLISIVNYIDRQALSILATTIQGELGISNTQYARLVQAFLLFYTLSYFLSGRIVDRFGPRLAETGFIIWWSVANMLTGLASGFRSLLVTRSLLGMGEPGHYAVSAKTVGEWFPPREKGIAVGMYTMGGTLGAAIAAPLVAFLTLHFSWRVAFVVTGAAGLILAAAWWWLYRAPEEHPQLSTEEREHLQKHGVLRERIAASGTAPKTPAPPFRVLIRWWPLWIVIAVRMITDPAWYFYLVWFAKYMQEVRGFTLGDIGATLWIVFLAADAGCLVAGFFSGRLIKRGFAPVRARVVTMAGCAVLMAQSFWLPQLPGSALPLAAASVFAFAIMCFMTCCVTLPIDIFPKHALGSVQGLIGTGGSLGGFFSTGFVGWLVTNHSYDAAFVAMSAPHVIATLLLFLALPRALARFTSPASP